MHARRTATCYSSICSRTRLSFSGRCTLSLAQDTLSTSETSLVPQELRIAARFPSELLMHRSTAADSPDHEELGRGQTPRWRNGQSLYCDPAKGCPRHVSGRLVPQKPYNRGMAVHVIGNPVPTPEEMAEILGLSPDRVKAIRQIMSTKVPAKKSVSAAKTTRKAAAKKASRLRTRRIAAKR